MWVVGSKFSPQILRVISHCHCLPCVSNKPNSNRLKYKRIFVAQILEMLRGSFQAQLNPRSINQAGFPYVVAEADISSNRERAPPFSLVQEKFQVQLHWLGWGQPYCMHQCLPMGLRGSHFSGSSAWEPGMELTKANEYGYKQGEDILQGQMGSCYQKKRAWAPAGKAIDDPGPGEKVQLFFDKVVY